MRALACGLVLGLTPLVWAQVSPGPLSRAHASLEGATQCFQCHGRASGGGSTDRRCLECHAEIAWLIENRRGLHGRESSGDCASCHPEHAGVDFDLIAWPEGAADDFRHQRTGWPLEGRHATLGCRACHKPELQRSAVGARIKLRDRGASYLGLERDCAACHADPHRGAFGGDCAACHGLERFRPATRFDHAATAFPLSGKHVGVACAKCHATAAGAPRYKPLPHAECSACHADPHAGRLGAGCAACHVTEGFASVRREGFDHARTRFPLRGKHAAVECARCHDPRSGWGKRPPSATCGACHADAHAGQATLAGRPADCAACHDERGFRPSTYTVERHRESPYPLEGRHAGVRCEGCHTKGAGATGARLRPAHERCGDCHAEAHGPQLASRPDGGACESCHGVAGWRPSSYTAERHAETRFALAGRHAEVACAACHGPERPGLPALGNLERSGPARVVLRGISVDCASCHLDPHAGKLTAGCAACHDTRAFRPSTLDAAAHARSGFPLDGAHRTVPCVRCHGALAAPPPEIRLLAVVRGSPRDLDFEERHDRCADCHADPHAGQFADRPSGGDCAACHDARAFRPATRFDHARDAAFALKGAHARAACAACHPARPDGDGRAVVVYRPLPHACQDCHTRPPGRGAAR